ncbi:MFS transporter [Catenulispora sp. NF23]|uniref:MFS transporter n=1 Tax=Catenulispora pinistramenti TaxID=2705254 RepID=UPI001BADE4F0|nr:MFS transporter [Catenulispora pinistramenti]MBS2536052.1 MFS transporter [Catenulispora pinistramenti]
MSEKPDQPLTAVAEPPPTAEARPGGRDGIVLAIIATAYLMIGLDATVVNIALPKIQAALGFTPVGLSWIINSYTLAFGGLLLLGGRLGDVLGRRRVLVSGTVLFTLASFIGGFSNSPGMLLGARIGQGVGAALLAPNTLALIAGNFAEGAPRNKALAVYSATAGAGSSVGLILGGVLTDWVSWRAVMFVNVPLGLFVALGAPRFIKEPERHQARIDYAGTVTVTAGMVSLVYAFIRVPTDGWSNGLTIACFVAAAVLLIAFVAIETRVRQPIVPLRLFKNRSRSGGYANILLLTAAMLSLFFFLSQFVQDSLKLSPANAGLAFLPMTVGMFATVSQVPKLLPKYGGKPLMVIGSALMTGAMLWLTQLSSSSGYWSSVFGPLLIFGVGMGLSFMPLNVTILAGVPREDSGSASGLVQTSMQLGGSLGLAVLVTVFGTAQKNAAGRPAGASPVVQAQHAFTHALQSAFSVAVVFVGLALVVALLVFKSKKAVAAAMARAAGVGGAAGAQPQKTG